MSALIVRHYLKQLIGQLESKLIFIAFGGVCLVCYSRTTHKNTDYPFWYVGIIAAFISGLFTAIGGNVI